MAVWDNRKAPGIFPGAGASTLVVDRYRMVTRVNLAPRGPGSRNTT